MKLKYLAFLPVLALLATPVRAEELSPTRGETMRQVNKEEKQQNRCQVINQRLDKTIKNYQTRKDIHITEYQRLHARLVTISGKLAAKGADVTKLNTDLSTLNDMIAKLSADYQAFVANLSVNRDQSCTLTLDQLRSNMANARNQLQAFRQQSKAIHEFIKSTIRKDLLALRAEVKPTPKATITPEPTSAE